VVTLPAPLFPTFVTGLSESRLNHASAIQLTPFPCYCADHSQGSLSLRDGGCFRMRLSFKHRCVLCL